LLVCAVFYGFTPRLRLKTSQLMDEIAANTARMVELRHSTVPFLLNMTDPKAVHTMLEALLLGRAHLVRFELMPLAPLRPCGSFLDSQTALRELVD
jgi:hypothetical protein